LLTDESYRSLVSKDVHFVPFDIDKKRYNPFFLYQHYKTITGFKPDIIHAHRQKSIQILRRLKWFLKAPFIATKHDTQKKKAFVGLDYAITISEETTSTIKAKHIYQINNGVPYQEPKRLTKKSSFEIVAIGSLSMVKDFGRLIEAVGSLPFECHLTIVGEGALREEYERLIQSLNIAHRVSLVGSKSNVQDYLASADLQVISSVSEGFGLVIVEGILYGKILISTRVGIGNEILTDDFLYNIEDLKEKITDVYHHQERYQKSFSLLKEKYKNKFLIENIAKEHINVYKDVIKHYKKEI
jgi:glycosyltransferase involved in cell wall biosynthesis